MYILTQVGGVKGRGYIPLPKNLQFIIPWHLDKMNHKFKQPTFKAVVKPKNELADREKDVEEIFPTNPDLLDKAERLNKILK